MKQVLIRKGQITLEDIPAPTLVPGTVLVEVAYSLISSGTELSALSTASKPLLERVIAYAKQLEKLQEHVRVHGVSETLKKLQNRLGPRQADSDETRPLGYSCAGKVLLVGEGVQGLTPGDRVACAGTGVANHAKLVLAPENLVAKVPEGCGLKDASSVALGAIAMQGVRRADPRLGEIVAIVGLGLLGQITVQLLTTAGCRVIGFDTDSRRVEVARQTGVEAAFNSTEVILANEIRHRTGDHGVDVTIITAAADSDTIIQQAMEITRKKGRVVIVGAVGLGLKRSPFYEKELDLAISCSYGPGRYDQSYETKGLDYPYAYVRWTENRNMQEYLRLVAEGRVRLDRILEREYDVQSMSQAYAELRSASARPLGVVLRYPGGDDEARQKKLTTRLAVNARGANGKISVAIIGAGSFAKATHLPNIKKLSDKYHLRAIVDADGRNAKAAAERFGAEYATTDYTEVLADDKVDMVLIATRHNLHARLAMEAARAGKAILLEKPMALNQTELDELLGVLRQTSVSFMMGFNRRFAPAARRAKEIIGEHQHPLMILYRVNAGYLPPDHWTQTTEGGGRIIGEACHIFDLFQYFAGAPVAEVGALAIHPNTDHILAGDNVSVTVRYEDGSVATLLYTALGPSGLSKEYMELYADGKALVLDDYRALRVYGVQAKGWTAAAQDKGHLEELATFGENLQKGAKYIIPLDVLQDVTQLTFIVGSAANAGGHHARHGAY